MSERKSDRRAAAAGALLVALGIAGLWLFLGDPSEAPGPENSSLTRSQPPVTRPTQATRPPPAPRPERPSKPGQDNPPTGVLEVEVFSENQPLPGARIQVYEREPGDPTLFPARWTGKDSGDTGENGRWVLPVSPGSYYVTARAEGLAPGYAAVVHPPSSARTRVRLILNKGVELVGFTFAKATGEPVSFAEVSLIPPALTSGAGVRPDVPEEEALVATSNQVGEFRFSGVAPGRYRIEARAPGYITAMLPSVPAPFESRVTLLMGTGGNVKGTVLGANAQPAPGAEVLALSGEQGSSVFTDDEGHFSFELASGTYSLSARKGEEAGALEGRVTVAVGQPTQGLRLQLGAGAWVSGKVLRKDGSPALGARVEALPPGSSVARGQTGTDERGAFSLPALAPGTYVLQVTFPEDRSFQHGPLTLAAGEHVSLTLTPSDEAPGEDIECLVVNPRSRPVTGIYIRISATTAVPKPFTGLTNSQGIAHISGLRPGTFRMEALYGGRPVGPEQPLLVQEGQRTPCYLQIPDVFEPEKGLVEGQVLLRSGGLPEEPVQIQVTGQVWSPQEKKQIQAPYKSFPADDQGRFQLALPPGPYTLSALRQTRLGCGTVEQSQIQVEAGQRAEATLLLEDPTSYFRLRVLDSEGAPMKQTLVKLQFHTESAFTDFIWTNAQGFVNVCLPPELMQPSTSFLLTVSTSSLRAVRPPSSTLTARAEVTSGTRELTVRLKPMAVVQGRIIHPHGLPVRNSIVDIRSLDPNEYPSTYAFMGDRFEIPQFPVGPAQLVVIAEGMSASLYLDLQPEERKVLELPVYPGVTVTGRFVNAATRQPVIGLLRFYPTETGPDGRFVLRDLPPGEFFLRIDLGPYLRVKLPPGQDTDLGEIAIPGR
ncbi:carboxypeptidase-like regulatory domain-containing protein [Hyalangium versicolor]|uniref:carboxypeptidase-like regulatory domain-containing protein n=1 Tax=Hyalangium versicolor TaxID=2861190 RepID=UPI001CCCD35E|nr:carboxypeptidase-like regulatory domain-containing protein [Hyalangium versicolor]